MTGPALKLADEINAVEKEVAPMQDIVENTVLLRGQVPVPQGLNLQKEGLREGWSAVQSGNSYWMDKEIRARGWHFIWIAEGCVRSGVGKSSQEAIACALKGALRRVSESYNAATVDHIALKKYPWFWLATVSLGQYQIQKSAFLPPLAIEGAVVNKSISAKTGSAASSPPSC